MTGGGEFLASNGDFLAGEGDGVGSDSGFEEDSVRLIGSETFAFFFGGPEELAPTMVSDLLVL